MEEDIKRLKAFLAVLNEENILYRKQDAIDGLLSLYKDLITQNKELEKANKIYVKIVRSWRERIKEIIYPSPENPIELEIQNSKMYKELEKLVED